MDDTDKFIALLEAQPKPVCAALTPFEVTRADCGAGTVELRFAPQPAFSNYFGNIQGGFGVAMIDVLISVAAFARLAQWCPTLEIKSTFLAPARLGTCRGEARILKAGKTVAFVEAQLWGSDGELAIHATATVAVKA